MKHLSLKTTLIWSFVFVAAIPLIVTSIWVSRELELEIEKETAEKNNLLTASIVKEVEQFIEMAVLHLEQVADLYDQGMIVSEKIDEYFELLVHHDDIFDSVEIISPQGYIANIFPFDENSIGLDVSNQNYFQEYLKTKAIYWSKISISLQTGEPTLTLSLPISEGILLGHLNLSSLSRITDRFKLGIRDFAQITDNRGNIIAGPDKALIRERYNASYLKPIQEGLTGNSGTYQYQFNETEWTASVAIVASNGWIVTYSQPTEDIVAPVEAMESLVLSGLVAAILTAAFIAAICLRYLLTPLNYLVEESKGITQGNFSARFQRGYFPELEQLANALNRMLETIKERETALQEEVSVRIQAENNLKNNQAHLQAILDHSPFLISIKNTSGDFLLVNQKFDILEGPSPEEFVGRNALDFFPKEVASKLWKNDMATLKRESAEEFEIELKHKDGTWHTYSSIKFPLKDEEGKIWGICTFSSDISEKKKFEEEKTELEGQLNQAQKIESIGTLAAGIAHDFNNILAAILGYAELALNEIDEPQLLENDLKEIIQGSRRAKELVEQILVFSRKNELELRPLRAQLIVKEAMKLLRSSIPSTIEIRQNIDPNCKAILADPSQIHQVVMNLCTNAFHAMAESGGLLTVNLNMTQLEADKTEMIPLKSGSYLKLEISDSGLGISKDILENIFEPYFTTKEKGRGTGLGLAVVYGIVTRLNGRISVVSQPGKGSTFTIVLPTIYEPKIADPEEHSTDLPRGKERILFVDDEPSIVQLNQKVLSKLGYQVTAFTHSPDALLLFQKNPEAFDLLITDMTMPKLTGTELAGLIRKTRPNLPIILCSGYSDNFSPEDAQQQGVHFMKKPLNLKDLANTVRKLADST
ncbi:MAG: response regulator [SAR324 cluster bacterium]|nr:response regulator [SAR324 cluster bacterium]